MGFAPMLTPVGFDGPVTFAAVRCKRDEQATPLQQSHRIFERLRRRGHVFKYMSRKEAIKLERKIVFDAVHIINRRYAEFLVGVASAGRSYLEGRDVKTSLGELIAAIAP